MARYILVHIDTQAVLGQSLNERAIRPFVSIAEAYETLARQEAKAGVNPDDAGQTFNAWTLCEVNPVERP
ncbi:MAG: hypothetical protein M5R36_25990 [Deltaproteobacteria bacterium]|nr:hypothetical protein [Deltaproteobacteria bacterium]